MVSLDGVSPEDSASNTGPHEFTSSHTCQTGRVFCPNPLQVPMPTVAESRALPIEDTSSSQGSELSWVSAGSYWGSEEKERCFLADVVFKSDTGCLKRARELHVGMTIFAWDQSLVEVRKVHIQPLQKQKLVQLHAGDACLTVTGSHRVLMQRKDSVQTSKACELEEGDFVMCASGLDLKSGRALDECRPIIKEVEVVQVQFVPDKPVAAVHMPSSAILSHGQGQSWGRTRRSGMGRRADANAAAWQQAPSIPDTASSWV